MNRSNSKFNTMALIGLALVGGGGYAAYHFGLKDDAKTTLSPKQQRQALLKDAKARFPHAIKKLKSALVRRMREGWIDEQSGRKIWTLVDNVERGMHDDALLKLYTGGERLSRTSDGRSIVYSFYSFDAVSLAENLSKTFGNWLNNGGMVNRARCQFNGLPGRLAFEYELKTQGFESYSCVGQSIETLTMSTGANVKTVYNFISHTVAFKNGDTLKIVPFSELKEGSLEKISAFKKALEADLRAQASQSITELRALMPKIEQEFKSQMRPKPKKLVKVLAPTAGPK